MSEAQLWYAGLPVTGTRWLDEDELRELRERVRRKPDESKVLIGFAIVAGSLLLLSIWIEDLQGFFRIVNLPLAVILTMATQRSTANKHLLRNDADSGMVAICSSLDQTIEVLPHSAMLWSVDGKRTTKWQRVTKSATMPMPEHAKMAANFVRPVEGAANNVDAHQRLLSDAEAMELASAMPAFPVRRAIGAALLIVVALLFLDGAIEEHFLGMGMIALIAAAIAAWVAMPLPRLLRFRRAIRRDIAQRTVIIVRQPDENEELGPALEYLAHSQIAWSFGGQPAQWRKVRG